MASSGIRDQVAIIGMGCTRFGELWDKGVDDLLIDAVDRGGRRRPGCRSHDIDAFWLGTMTSGVCGVTLSRPLKLDYKPVTRVENYCATGSEAFRNACYAVASGAYDIGHGDRGGEAQGHRLLGPDRHPRRSATAPTPGCRRPPPSPSWPRPTPTSTASTGTR